MEGAAVPGDEFVFQILTDLNEDDVEFNGIVLAFKGGADLSLQQDKMQALASCLDGQMNVRFDSEMLDILYKSIASLDHSGKQALQQHRMSLHLATCMYGLLASPPCEAFRASRVYLALLRAYGANASLILNAFFMRRILSTITNFLASYRDQAPDLTQDVSTQQSIQLTPDMPASQFAQLPVSQKPKRRKGGKKAGDLGADWEQAYNSILDIINMFENGHLFAYLDSDLVAVILESCVHLPGRELTGPLKAAGVLSSPSKILVQSFAVLKHSMQDNTEHTIYEQEGQDETAARERTVTTQQLILPLLLPLLHLSLHYIHSNVKLSDAVVLQTAALNLLKESDIEKENLLLLFKLLLQTGEKRPRSDPILIASKGCVALLNLMDKEKQLAAIQYLVEMGSSERVYHRLFAVEVVHTMLRDGPALASLGVDGTQDAVKMLFSAINDTAAIVRTKALTNLSKIMQAIGAPDSVSRGTVSAYLVKIRTTSLNPSLAAPSVEGVPEANPETPSVKGTPKGMSPSSDIAFSPGAALVSATEMNHLLASVVARTREEKALVRKAAIDLLLQFFEHKVVEAGPIMSTVVELMDIKMEPSVLVRRQAVLCAWAIILHFSDIDIRSKMMGAILQNYTLESEDFVVKTMLQSVQVLVVLPLTGDEREFSTADVWQLTASFTDAQLSSLGKMCYKLVEHGEVKGSIVTTLLNRIDEHPSCRDAWSLLPIVAKKFKNKISSKIVMKCFQELQGSFDNGSTKDHAVLHHVLSLMPVINMPNESKQEVTRVLEQLLLSMSCHVNLVHCAVTCYAVLMKDTTIHRLAVMFIKLCHTLLYNLLTNGNHKPLPQEATSAGLSAVSLVELPVAICTMGSLILTSAYKGKAADIMQISEMINAACNTITITDDVDMVVTKTIPEQVLRHCFLCQVKLCMFTKAVCKKGVPILLQGLESQEVSIRTTCLNGLADLSIKYPGTVDKYLPNIAALLSDHDVKVRLTSVTLLTQLLGESFVKLRPFLVFEVLALVADVNDSVAAFARYSLLKVMVPKDPYLITNNFKEVLFVLNNYPFHPKYNKMHSPIVKLTGDGLRHTRVQLMRFLASQLTTEKDLLRVHEQLHDILEMCCVEGGESGTLNLTCVEGVSVFKDCVQVLLSQEMNLAGRVLEGPKKATNDPTEQEDEDAESQMRKALWAGVVRTRLRDMVCPVIISVCSRLRQLRSPLQKDMVHYATYIIQDHMKDLGEFIPDKQLQKDIKATLEETAKRGKTRKLGTIIPKNTPSITPLKRSSSSSGSSRTPTRLPPPRSPSTVGKEN
eukprot:TRINITY_DN5406_c0_g1_i1.p1 TRINITY_DN5406_c0_g1~~TRINITY_DN5406_c0_g1_i1.p1  ORF type:complete len:1328 (+),score=392.77 TRINITY_DN5406_c0_g1_i1:95-3985(+)